MVIHSYSMKCWLRVLGVISTFLILGSQTSNAQQTVESFVVDGYTFSQDRKELTKVVDECSDYLNRITVKSGSKTIFVQKICGEDINDVRFIHKGYLTVLEHYSSSVGWFEYIVFDLCKHRIITTKRIEEGQGIFEWKEFITLDEAFKKKFVEKVTSF